MVLIPAYGRRTNKEQTISDWNNGKDFKISGGPYCSIRDFEALKTDFGDIHLAYFNPNGTMGAVTVYLKNPIDHYIPSAEV